MAWARAKQRPLENIKRERKKEEEEKKSLALAQKRRKSREREREFPFRAEDILDVSWPRAAAAEIRPGSSSG